MYTVKTKNNSSDSAVTAAVSFVNDMFGLDSSSMLGQSSLQWNCTLKHTSLKRVFLFDCRMLPGCYVCVSLIDGLWNIWIVRNHWEDMIPSGLYKYEK